MIRYAIRFSTFSRCAELMPTSERVPSRPTADMVDGLGVSGVQGFQCRAEETFRVLRRVLEAGSDVIMTVLEVFKHDPLQSWYASYPPAVSLQHCGAFWL